MKLQAGDLDAMLVNLAIARDVAAGKPLNYRMVDDGRAKRPDLHGRRQGNDHHRRQVAAGHQGVSAPTATSRRCVWVVDGMPAPARILQRKDGQDEMDLRCALR